MHGDLPFHATLGITDHPRERDRYMAETATATATETDHAAFIADVADKYPDKYLQCRDYGHGWKPNNAVWLEDGFIERVLRCDRCKTERFQILDKNGYIISGYYHYSSGYQIPGAGRLDTNARAVLRHANLLRIMNA